MALALDNEFGGGGGDQYRKLTSRKGISIATTKLQEN